MAAIVATIILATAAGIAAERRLGGRAGLASRRALLFVLYAVLPPVTFFNLVRVEIDADLGIGVALAGLGLAAAAGLSWVVGSRLFHLSRPAVGSMISCTLVANTGYLGYPLVAVTFGLESLSEAVVYDILVASPALLLGAFSVGAAFGTRAGETIGERARSFFVRNPPLYAAALALVAPDALAPDVLVDASRIAIIAVLPVGFFAVGAALAEEAQGGRLPLPPPLERPVAAVIAIRMLVAPGLLYLLAAPVIALPETYLLLAAMPCGLNTMIVTHAYGLDLRIAAEAIAWSTALAVVAMVPLSLIT